MHQSAWASPSRKNHHAQTHDAAAGRNRRDARNYLQLPLSFRDYCTAAHGIRFDDKPLAAEEFLSPQGEGVASEFLAEIFTLLTVFYWDIGRSSLEPSKQRKLYWLDPLMGAMPRALIPGTRAPDEDGMVECAVAAVCSVRPHKP